MARRPIAQDYVNTTGDGKFGSIYDYLKADPYSYYYQKLKTSDVTAKYLDDQMWSEAAQRGETSSVISYLSNLTKDSDTSMLDKWNNYPAYTDYDSYMLALAIPSLDDTKKVDRVDEETGYKFGSYTDKEWATQILESNFQGYDAQILDEEKANQKWYEKLGNYVVSGAARFTSGVMNFVSDVGNVVEGVLNLFINLSQEDTLGARFLYAFQNDDMLAQMSEYLQKETYEWERQHMDIVSAYEAYQGGYNPETRENYGQGYTTWGRWWTSGIESIGYMLPSMLFGGFLGATTSLSTGTIGAMQTSLFYTGIFSGNVSDTVERATLNGQSYKNLNAGMVVANAGLKAAAQLAIEEALGKIMGFSSLDRMMGTAGAATQRAVAKGIKGAGQVFGRMAKDMFKEGLEELFQDLSDDLIDMAFGGDYYKRGVENLTIQNLTDAFVVGALVSGVTSIVNNTKVIMTEGRAIGTDVDGEIYKMGIFETLNYREAVNAMSEWNEVLEDEKASPEAKAEAAFKMSVTIDSVGSVIKSLGTDRAIAANNVLIDSIDFKMTKGAVKAIFSDSGYARNLYQTFVKEHNSAVEKYELYKVQKKVEKAIAKEAKLLEKKNVNNISNIITKDVNTADPDIPVDNEPGEKIKASLKGIGAEVIVGVDGNIVRKSEEVVFVDNKLIEAGDVAEIIRGIAYDQVQQAVLKSLSSTQRQMLTQQYEKITGTDGTLEDAVTALLFDKNFYTYTLLKSQERHYKTEAIQILATIDKLVKAKVGEDVKNGKVSTAAYKALMEKVQATMRAGLVTYATQYNRIDLGTISNDILPTELKNAIKYHQNVRFSEEVDLGIKNKSDTVLPERVEQYDKYIAKFVDVLGTETVEQLKKQARSSDYNKRVEAWAILAMAGRNDKIDLDKKLIYLPLDPEDLVKTETLNYVSATENFFGNSWGDMLTGKFDPNKISKEAANYAKNFGPLDDTQSRLSCMRAFLYKASNGTLTIGNGGSMLRVFDKQTFVKDEYLGKEGSKKFREDLLSQKVKTLGDIAKVNLPTLLKGVTIAYDPYLAPNSNNPYGYHVDNTTDIILGGYITVNTVMHEATHIAQDLTAIDQDNVENIRGGNQNAFRLLPDDVIKSLSDYLKETFPVLWKYAETNEISTPEVVYFTLGGELQAKSTLTTHMFDIGFRFENGRQTLVSPDGKQRWSMTPDVDKYTKDMNERAAKAKKDKMEKLKAQPPLMRKALSTSKEEPLKVTKTEDGLDLNSKGQVVGMTTVNGMKVSYDAPLTRDNIRNISEDPDNQEALKHTIFKTKTGYFIVFYRGASREQEFGRPVDKNNIFKSGEFYTTNYLFASGYDKYSTADMTRGYIIDASRDQVFYIDAKGNRWNDLHQIVSKKDLHQIKVMIKESLPASMALREFVDKRGDWGSKVTSVEDFKVHLKVLPDDDVSAINKTLSYFQKFGLDETRAINFLSILAQTTKLNSNGRYHQLNNEFTLDTNMLSLIGIMQGKSVIVVDNVRDWTPKDIIVSSGMFTTNQVIVLDPKVLKRVTVDTDTSTINLTQNKRLSKTTSPKLELEQYVALSKARAQAFEDVTTDIKANGGDFNVSSFVKTDLYSQKSSKYGSILEDGTILRGKIKKNFIDNTIYALQFSKTTPKIELEMFADDYTNSIIKFTNISSPINKGIIQLDFDGDVYKLAERGMDVRQETALIKLFKEILQQEGVEKLQVSIEGFSLNDIIEDDVKGFVHNILLPEILGGKTISESLEEPIGKDNDSRYISNKVAKESNMKYWIQKGIPIQVHPAVRDFVVATTKDFDKLPTKLKQLIKKHALTKYDLIDIVATSSNLDDYTFKAIAEHAFHNEELAKLTFKEMRSLMDNIEELATVSTLVRQLDIDPNEHRSVKDLLALVKSTMQKANDDKKFGSAYTKAAKAAQTVNLYGQGDGKNYYTESHADVKQLNLSFFEHYDGSLTSLRDINNIAKYTTAKQIEQELIENAETGELVGTKSKKAWNWIDKKRTADIDYVNDDVAKTVKSLPREDKVADISNYISEVISDRARKMLEGKNATESQKKSMYQKALTKIRDEINLLETLSDETIDARWLQVKTQEIKPRYQRKIKNIIGQETLTREQRGELNIAKGKFRQATNKLTKRIAGLKTNYNTLSNIVKEHIDPKTFKRTQAYRTMSTSEIEALTEAVTKDADKLKKIQSASRRAQKAAQQTQERLKRTQAQLKEAKEQVKQLKEENKKKTIREKVQTEYKTKVKTQTFEFVSPDKANDVVNKVLNTAWTEEKMSKVQGVTTNIDQEVANAKTFYEVNAEVLGSASIADIEEATKFFLDAKMNNVTDPEYKKYEAVKMYFLGWVYDNSLSGKLYEGFNANLRQRVDNYLRSTATVAGTMLSVWNNITKTLDPTSGMKSAEMEIDGVALTDEEKDRLFEAIKSSDMDKVKAIQQEIIKRISNERTSKKSLLRKVTTLRSMAMLSSPITWLRNKVSNMVVKRVNKLSSAIGNKLWTGKTVKGQLKLTSQVTPQIQGFIDKHFLSNGLFDQLVGNLSKYNPSDIAGKYKTAEGNATKEAIMAQLVIKSMYNQYYNENLFKNKWMNSVHSMLMKALSDNSYVREATIRYFGKIIAEKGYDLTRDTVSDAIMNDFATSAGLALADYMHSDNVMHKIENLIKEKGGETGLFAWKLALPFASASWQWFKAALKLSPLGLGRAIVNMARLETNVAKAQADWAAGKSQISPELTEYIARRDLGQGVIGTIAWGLGLALAGLGFIKLDDDDRGKPQLVIGNLKIDVSTIFGSSSLLAGAALVTGVQDKGMTWDGILEGMNRMSDVFVDDLFLMDIIQMDMYGESFFDMLTNNLESIALSFIPNIVSWIAGATYSGTLKKSKLWEKAIAKIPFLNGALLEKKVDPYTGETGSYWDAINRTVPYISVITKSNQRKATEDLGLTKKELTGKYEINGEAFNLSNAEVTAINKAYGSWNAKDLADFYDGKTSVKIKVGDKYKTLKYNQMDDEQRRTAVQQLMSKNASYAKIMAWTKNGNKYYASADEYTLLRQHGIMKNVYRGTKGFVKVS